jgi:predicted phosphodiesterase
VLVPGDLTNRACKEGLQQGWEFALEIGRAVNARHVIPVLGNHDVDSRREHNPDPCYFARSLRGGFPLQDERACDEFFSRGSCVIGLNASTQILLINSVIDHHDEKSAMQGAFNDKHIDNMRQIGKRYLRSPIRIALMHHHPVVHSGALFSPSDVIPTGDAIIAALKDLKCRFVIHGHKHHARLQFDEGMVVFAAGSFSALLQEYSSSSGNMFHLIDVEAQDSLELPIRGQIRTWQFQMGNGWVSASQKYSGFPFLTGFGRVSSLDAISNALLKLAAVGHRGTVAEAEVLRAAPELLHLTPAEFQEVASKLKEEGLKFPDYGDGRFSLGREVLR